MYGFVLFCFLLLEHLSVGFAGYIFEVWGYSVELYLKILKIVVKAFTQKKGPELVNLADTFVRFSALS